MKNIMIVIMLIAISSCGSSKNTNKKNASKTTSMDISMFPKAKENQVQHIINLEALKNENEHKIEVFITKELEVDCNHHTLTGKLIEKNLSGWGYNYYEFETNGQVMSTMMACPENTRTKKDVFSQSKLLRYNSKLPIVIYTPKGYKVKYKMWGASSKIFTAIKK